MRDDDQTLLLLLAFGWAMGWFERTIAPALSEGARALQEGGAALYEWLHPAEREHGNDLPARQLSRDYVANLAARTGFPDPRLAMAIASAESGLIPNAYTLTEREESVGLWQINRKAHAQLGLSREELSDPVVNARAAYVISKGGRDWRPWSAYQNRAYEGYL